MEFFVVSLPTEASAENGVKSGYANAQGDDAAG
jgi:hypothetical protein